MEEPFAAGGRHPNEHESCRALPTFLLGLLTNVRRFAWRVASRIT
jgi:hypothetical protein